MQIFKNHLYRNALRVRKGISKGYVDVYLVNDMMIGLGGKLYIRKTPVLNKNQFEKMHPNIGDFIKLKDKLDSENLMKSLMYRRILELKDVRSSINNYYNY